MACDRFQLFIINSNVIKNYNYKILWIFSHNQNITEIEQGAWKRSLQIKPQPISFQDMRHRATSSPINYIVLFHDNSNFNFPRKRYFSSHLLTFSSLKRNCGKPLKDVTLNSSKETYFFIPNNQKNLSYQNLSRSMDTRGIYILHFF